MFDFLNLSFLNSLSTYITIGIILLVALPIVVALLFRVVVPANEFHIIQRSNSRIIYGLDRQSGNVYYNFPSWIPKFGVSVIILPGSVFAIKLENYEAYDLDRLPFIVDLTAFFRIDNPELASQRINNIKLLEAQLSEILQGSARAILSSRNLSEILQIRSELGDDFTNAVKEQLTNWGVSTVKNIELMDIRDSGSSKVIFNIMAMKQSEIEKESRIVVAQNKKTAQIVEIEAQKEADVSAQEAEKQVGLKTVENQREVAISNERAKQNVSEEQKLTTEREMEVKKVQEVQKAEIDKNVAIIQAEQNKKQIEIRAEAEKTQVVLKAEADLEEAKRKAEGIAKIGEAEAEAKRLLEVANVSGQIELAKEISSSTTYQEYLSNIRGFEAIQHIGTEQAKALANADLKFIINGNSASDGIGSISDLLSSKGGIQLGSLLEGFKSTTDTSPIKLLSSLGKSKEVNLQDVK